MPILVEETGLELKNPKLKGRILFPNNLQKNIDWHVYVFVANEFEGDLIADSPEGKLEWIDNDKLLELNIWPSDKIFIPWLDRDDFFSAKFIYDKTGLKDHIVVFHKYEK